MKLSQTCEDFLKYLKKSNDLHAQVLFSLLIMSDYMK